MALQGGRRELMPGEYLLDASVINRLVVALSDNPGQLACGERLGPGPLLPSHGPTRFIARQRVTIRSRVTAEEVELEHTSRRLRHRFLLPHQQSAKHVREGSDDA
jgi:hypothetical protein